MRVYFGRKYGKAIEFIAVVERHPQSPDWPHLHVLISQWIPHEWMKESWSALGGGEILWVEPISLKRIAGYLAKYLTEEKAGLPADVRRFSASRGIVLFKRAGSDEREWFLSRLPIEVLRPLAHYCEAEESSVAADGTETLLWFVAEYIALVAHFVARRRGAAI